MKSKTEWPSLNERLKHPIQSRQEAIKQLKQAGMELSPVAEKHALKPAADLCTSVEMADKTVLEAVAARRAGSSPA